MRMEDAIDITQLEAFKMIAGTESLTRAAEKLHISQPAMSAMLKRLETNLGAELFHRSPNQIRLNGTGELKHPKLETIPFLNDKVYLSVPKNPCAGSAGYYFFVRTAHSALTPPHYRRILGEVERIIKEEHLSLTPVKNEYLMTQHMGLPAFLYFRLRSCVFGRVTGNSG